MMTMTMIMMISMAISFSSTKHPLSMGLNLLIQTNLVAIFTGLNWSNSWFSFIMFMIMIGGMLVLFIYMTSIASNEKFKFSIKMMILFMMTIMMSCITLMNKNQMSMNMNIKSEETMKMMTKSIYEIPLTKFMNMPTSTIMLMLITYLLIAMIAVVKITNINSGPLRKK